MYKCPNCGGEIQFQPENGKIKCEYCGSVFSVDDNIGKTRKNAQESAGPDGEGKIYTCSQCGASIYTTEETGVTFCSYCGSQAFLESRIKGDENVMPDVIIPFKISKEECGKIYKDKIKHAWFLPREMKSDTTIDKFRGIYMPCWIYTAQADADGRYEATRVRIVGGFDEYTTYEVTAHASGVYGGFVEDSSSSFPDGIMREISPFDMNNACAFDDKYMAGFYADIGNLPPDTYKNEILAYAKANVKEDLRKDKEIRNSNVSGADIDEETNVEGKITEVRKGFLPVWFLSNKNEHTGMMSYAVINGLTGKIHADLPIDMKKYLILSLIIAIPAFILLQFLTMRPTTLVKITMMLLCIMMVFSTGMIREKYIQENGLDDEGLLYQKNKAGIGSDANDSESVDTASFKKKKKKKGSCVLVGILCFIIVPAISLILTSRFGTMSFSTGIAAGIFLYCIIVGNMKTDKKAADGGFEITKRIKVPFYITLRSVALPVIGIIVGAIVLAAAPAHDLYYYLTAILCCIMLILTVLDFVKANNRLSLRKPAQLGKRGGDESEN